MLIMMGCWIMEGKGGEEKAAANKNALTLTLHSSQDGMLIVIFPMNSRSLSTAYYCLTGGDFIYIPFFTPDPVTITRRRQCSGGGTAMAAVKWAMLLHAPLLHYR